VLIGKDWPSPGLRAAARREHLIMTEHRERESEMGRRARGESERGTDDARPADRDNPQPPLVAEDLLEVVLAAEVVDVELAPGGVQGAALLRGEVVRLQARGRREERERGRVLHGLDRRAARGSGRRVRIRACTRERNTKEEEARAQERTLDVPVLRDEVQVVQAERADCKAEDGAEKRGERPRDRRVLEPLSAVRASASMLEERL